MKIRRTALLLGGLWLVLEMGALGPRVPRAQAQPLADTTASEALAQARRAVARHQWDDAIDRLHRVVKKHPEHLDARYLRGLAYREKEKSATLLSNSLADFAYVVARDSLFRDVLFQYGLTLSYREQYPEDLPRALDLAETQLRLKPDLSEVRRGLIGIYRYFVRSRGPSKALAWLDARGSDYARYFRGEALRRDGQLEQADAVFAMLLDHPPEEPSLAMPRQPILLSRARVHYALGDPERAQHFVETAIRTVDGAEAAHLVFDDFKYIVSEDELRQFRALRTPAAIRAFFETLWEKRDPMPAGRVNARLAEHYRRLAVAERDYPFFGFRVWYTSPDLYAELDLPATYTLGDEFDDRGLVYIRHGEPLDREVYVGPSIDAESWRYADLDFHFSPQSNQGHEDIHLPIVGVGNYRFLPTPHPALLDKVLLWDADYMGLSKDADLVRDLVVRKSRAYVREGMTTDRHSWDDDVQRLDVPHLLAAFRGDDGETVLAVHYALPVGQLTQALDEPAPTIDVEVGVALHDTLWHPVGTHVETKRLPPRRDPTAGVVDFFRLSLPPDAYRVALHARSLQTTLLGGYTLTVRLPDFSRLGLNMSDVLPAYSVGPTDAPGRFSRHGLDIQANPFRRFAVNQAVYVYFEIYGLTLDDHDRTRYSIAYTLTSEKTHGKVLGLFGGRKTTLTIKTEHTGTEVSPIAYTEIDVRSVPPDRYTLTVRVQDERRGTVVERSQALDLYE